MGRRRILWIAFASLVVALLVATVVWRRFSIIHLQPWRLLAHVVNQADGPLSRRPGADFSRWTGGVSPVVECACKKGERLDAIPLDQVMLREQETRFRLCVPAAVKYQRRVFNRYGLLKTRVDFAEAFLIVVLEM